MNSSNEVTALDAAMTLLFHVVTRSRGASEFVSHMRACPQCGAELVIEHPKGPTLWVTRCTACSYEGGGTVNFGIELPHDPDADTDVVGYFQLSDLAQFTTLRTVLPDLQSEPSVQIIERLRSDGLRWHIGSLKKWRAQRYQRVAREHGLEFVIVA